MEAARHWSPVGRAPVTPEVTLPAGGSPRQVPVKDLITRHLPLGQALEAFGIVQRGEAIKVTVEP